MVNNPDVPTSTDGKQPRRELYVIGLILATLIVVPFLIAAVFYYHKMPGLKNPMFSNVEESDIVVARVVSDRLSVRKKKPVGGGVSPLQMCEFLAALTPNRIDKNPPKWEMLGTLELKLKSGKEYFVSLYQTGGNEAAFSINRVYYRGGSDAKLMELMREAEKMIEGAHEPRPEER